MIAAGRALEPLNHTVGFIEADGGRAAAITADVTRSADLAELVAQIAKAHGSLDIRINAIGPGPVDTPMSYRPGETRSDRDARMREQLPAGRVGDLDEFAAAALYLASGAAGFVVGADLLVDGEASAWKRASA